MTIAESLISGIVQGITEFLPISSSGHLVLIHSVFGMNEPNMVFDIFLHFATLLAVLVYFRNDIAGIFKNRDVKLFFYICVATIPAVLAALLFEEKIASFFTSLKNVSMMFIVTSVILFVGQFFMSKKKREKPTVTLGSSFFVGIMQAFALFPGLSRSGSTISAGLVSGMGREESFRFSFLLAIPVILGATVYKFADVVGQGLSEADIRIYLAGMLTAFVAGLISLKILSWIIRAGKLYIFGIYCLVLGISIILFL